MLSYSRGALVALAIGLAVWFAAVPLRLRAVAALLCSSLAAVPVVLWAFAQDGLTVDRAPMAARVDAGHELGALLLLLVAVLGVAGLAVGFFTTRSTRRTRGRAGSPAAACSAGLALVPVAVLIALAASPGGVSGQTSDAWSRLTDPQARTPGNTPDRLAATSSVRAQYWDEALKVHADSTVVGTGAGSYAVVRTRYRQNGDVLVRHAHGYFVQTLSDLGWVGLGLSLLAALAWVLTAARALGMRRQRPRAAVRRRTGRDVDDGGGRRRVRAALRDRLDVVRPGQRRARAPARRLGGRPRAAAGTARARGGAGRRRVAEPAAPRAGWRRYAPAPVGGLLAALAIAIALLAAWTAYQPQRSVDAGDEALALLDRGQYEQAVAMAQTAVDRNPLSPSRCSSSPRSSRPAARPPRPRPRSSARPRCSPPAPRPGAGSGSSGSTRCRSPGAP